MLQKCNKVLTQRNKWCILPLGCNNKCTKKGV